MRAGSGNRLVVALGFLAVAAGVSVLLCIRRDDASAPGPGPARSAQITPPEPLRPVPPALEGVYGEIQRRRASQDFLGAAQGHAALLKRLEAEWGKDSPDLAPYHYDFALTLKLANRPPACDAAIRAARSQWPDHLQLRLLDLTCRAERAIERKAFDAEAHALFRAVLAPDLDARVRGLRIHPERLYQQWVEMLTHAQRSADALEIAGEALRLSPDDRALRTSRARLLLALERNQEALPLLEELARAASSPEVELLLGSALLESGNAAAAWERFSPLLARMSAPGPDGKFDPTSIQLRLVSTRALNQLGRAREAAGAILPLLSKDPWNVSGLQALSSALRRSTSSLAAQAVETQVRRLLARERLLEMSRKARATGMESSALFYQAQASTLVHRCDEALRALDAAIALSPALVPLRLEKARVLTLLGLNGDVTEDPPAAADDSARQLLRAEACLASGQISEAEGILSGRFEETPGGPEWARALRSLLGFTGEARSHVFGREADADPSDFLDHPRLFASPTFSRCWSAGPESARWEALRGALLDWHRRRQQLVRGVQGRSVNEGKAGWLELLALYAQARAARKTRELAWLLVERAPDDLEVRRKLAEVLNRPEETIEKLSVIEDGLRNRAGDPVLREMRARCLAFLGLAEEGGK